MRTKTCWGRWQSVGSTFTCTDWGVLRRGTGQGRQYLHPDELLRRLPAGHEGHGPVVPERAKKVDVIQGDSVAVTQYAALRAVVDQGIEVPVFDGPRRHPGDNTECILVNRYHCHVLLGHFHDGSMDDCLLPGRLFRRVVFGDGARANRGLRRHSTASSLLAGLAGQHTNPYALHTTFERFLGLIFRWDQRWTLFLLPSLCTFLAVLSQSVGGVDFSNVELDACSQGRGHLVVVGDTLEIEGILVELVDPIVRFGCDGTFLRFALDLSRLVVRVQFGEGR